MKNAPIFTDNAVKLYHWFQDDEFKIKTKIHEEKIEIEFKIIGISDLTNSEDIDDWYELINYFLIDKETHDDFYIFLGLRLTNLNHRYYFNSVI